MNREILFRGKAINRCEGMKYRTNYKNGDWVYGLISKPYCERFPNLSAEMTNTSGFSGIEVDYTTIGQYTDLTDRNGVRIFEGDILEALSGNRGYVVFEHGAFMKLCDPKDMPLLIATDVNAVIGNIHDNPELMKGVENV